MKFIIEAIKSTYHRVI